MYRKLLLIPLVVFILLAVFFYYGLFRDPREIPSPLIGKPVPAFALPDFNHPEKTINNKSFAGEVWLLNVWASWCVSCRDEHPVLVRNARTIGVPIVGLNYKDKHADGEQWLELFGNPYSTSIFDEQGSLGLDLGVYGVPETFLIDKSGIIRYKHIGPINEQSLHQVIIPKIKELQS